MKELSKEQTELEDLPPVDLDTVLDDFDLDGLDSTSDLMPLSDADDLAGLSPLEPESDAGMNSDDLEPEGISNPSASEMALEEDTESLALSEEELDHILGSGDSAMFEDLTDSTESMEIPQSSEDDLSSGAISDMPDLADIPSSSAIDDTDILEIGASEVPDIDLSFPDDLTGGPSFDADGMGSGSTNLDSIDYDIPTSGMDESDEGPIALSEDELGSILSDVEASESLSMGGDDHAAPGSAKQSSAAPDEEEDENIKLSDEELSMVLLDTNEKAGSPVMPAETVSSLDLEDEEPITLTAEELGNIVSEVETGHEDISGMPEIVTEDADADAMPSVFSDEEDDGPVSLSDSELDSILEDVTHAPVEEAMDIRTPSTEHLIVLDDYDDEAVAEAKKPEAPGLSKEDLNKEELRKMISYLDRLFDQLPEDTIREFSHSEYFDLYRKIMSELGLHDK